MTKALIPSLSVATALLCLASMPQSSLAQENVTIPKSRLDELEKKAAELDRLKGDLNKTKAENVQLQRQNQEANAKLATLPGVAPATNTSPAITTLPPLTEHDIVEAEDLANYFKFDPKAAEQRFAKRKFRIRGIVAGFEKPPFIRPYKVLLKTADPHQVVACEFSPEDRFSAVFPAKNGTELRGLDSGVAIIILRLGDHVLVDAECRRGRESGVIVTGFKLEIAP